LSDARRRIRKPGVHEQKSDLRFSPVASVCGMDEQIQAMNQITAMIDEKAALYKEERPDMPAARAAAEKKLLLDLIQDGIDLAQKIQPVPTGLLHDFQRLQKQIQDSP